jgi:hypothetical protein
VEKKLSSLLSFADDDDRLRPLVVVECPRNDLSFCNAFVCHLGEIDSTSLDVVHFVITVRRLTRAAAKPRPKSPSCSVEHGSLSRDRPSARRQKIKSQNQP